MVNATKKNLYFWLFVLLPAVVMANAVDDLPAGHWLEVPNSQLRPLDPDFQNLTFFTKANPDGAVFDRNFRGIMLAWNGGAYDTKRDRLIIWGGGHNDYPGNGIYTFDVGALIWEQAKAPASLDGWADRDVFYQDASPVSRHTYDYLEYIPPPVDRFISAGGSALWQTSFLDFNTLLFDFDTGTWEVGPEKMPNADVAAISGFDLIGGKVWVHGSTGSRNYLSAYDPLTKAWHVHGNSSIELDGMVGNYWVGAVDPVRRKFVAIGNVGRKPNMPEGGIYVWDITKEGYIAFDLMITTGATEILKTSNPGFVYDPVSDKFIAWNGTTAMIDSTDKKLDPEPSIDPSDIYVLDMDTAVWDKVSPAESNTVIPGAANSRGTFGRFRYVPSKNVFVLVNSVDENVYFYRYKNVPNQTVPVAPGALSVTITLVP